MQILEIGARNFLSFDEMYLEPDPWLTGIVGPNGSGKSNLARILRMSREVLLQGGSLGSWAGAGRLGRDIQKDPSVEARLKVELDRVEERVALAVFIRYALRPRLPAGMGAERVEFRAVPFFQLEHEEGEGFRRGAAAAVALERARGYDGKVQGRDGKRRSRMGFHMGPRERAARRGRHAEGAVRNRRN